VNELERIEALAYRQVNESADGGEVADVRGGVCLAIPAVRSPEVNRVAGVTDDLDLDAVAAFFAAHGVPYMVSVPPGLDRLEGNLRERGYAPGYAWMKFERDTSPPAETATDLRFEETADAAAFGLVGGETFAGSAEHAGFFENLVGLPGWHCFVGWDGDEPAAAGALFVDGDVGWVGIGATRERFRRRGAQSAILSARIAKARGLGLRLLVTETGERQPDRPAGSYRNILRAGFREAYLRANWRPAS